MKNTEQLTANSEQLFTFYLFSAMSIITSIEDERIARHTETHENFAVTVFDNSEKLRAAEFSSDFSSTPRA